MAERDGAGYALFPAWAGVILLKNAVIKGWITFPRMGGGDPVKADACIIVDYFSPHGRG